MSFVLVCAAVLAAAGGALANQVDGAVHVSEFLARGDAAGAREASKVQLRAGDPFSYSGYFTVDNKTDSNMFFWYFPPQKPSANKSNPTVMWLQGGPGGSSLFGLFVENGPFELTADLKMVPRRVGDWNEHYGMLYVDNPVGTGFSYTKGSEGYCNGELCVARNLYWLLQDFFKMFPDLKQNDFFVSGESYAGKYIPAITHYILEANKHGGEPQIPLKGMTIGDGLCDPITQVRAYPEYAYYTGLVDEEGRQRMWQYVEGIEKSIRVEDWSRATRFFNELVNGQWAPSYFTNVTGIWDYFDIRRTEVPNEYFGRFAKFVNQSSIRAKLHVGSHFFYQSNEVYDHLADDMMKSVVHYIPALLDNYRVMFYSGQFDFIVAAPTTEAFLRSLDWKDIEGWRRADRKIWYTDGDKSHVSGYVKAHKELTYVLVRDSGHILPFDQPLRAKDMVTRFIDNLGWE
jgi:vitellogenic carboxypeptidase-like protein